MTHRRRKRKKEASLAEGFILSLIFIFFIFYNPIREFLSQPLNFSITMGGVAAVGLWLILYVLKRIRIRRLNSAINKLALGGVADLYRLNPVEFEKATAAIFRSRGYRAAVTQGSADRGIDVNLEKDGEFYAVQCKRYDPNGKKVGSPDIRDFVGAMDGAGIKKGFFVTTSTFSSEAVEAAKNSSFEIVLVDGQTLAKAQDRVREQLAKVRKSINTDLIPLRGWSKFPNWQRVVLFCLGFGSCWATVTAGVYVFQ